MTTPTPTLAKLRQLRDATVWEKQRKERSDPFFYTNGGWAAFNDQLLTLNARIAELEQTKD